MSNLSLLTTIIESTFSFNLFKPEMELTTLFLPSKVNGRVTMAITKAPASRAIRATTGAAPVPVPPPIPAAIKTIFAPLTISLMSSTLASAAFSPISGSPPAPKPPVISWPRIKRWRALLVDKACLSVLATQNSTLAISSSIIRLTALLPAPPTPMTTILATGSKKSKSQSCIIFSPFIY